MRKIAVSLLAISLLLTTPGTVQSQVTLESLSPANCVLTLNPGQVANAILRVCLPGNTPALAAADIYFLADTTGSMGPALTNVKANANMIVASLLAMPMIDLAVGVGQYKDFPFDAFAFQHQLSPTTTQASVVAAINTWTAGGGNDIAEGQFFAFHNIANNPAVGFRPGAKRIVVWFGDAPGHDPICTALTGLGAPITEASITADLLAAGPGGTTVIAISTPTGVAGALDANPVPFSGNYNGPCMGVIGGAAGQAARITAATGGLNTAIGNSAAITAAILSSINTVLMNVDVSLAISGAILPFFNVLAPPVHTNVIIPADPTAEVCVVFEGNFVGLPCVPGMTTFTGQIEVLIDGAPTGVTKPFTITQPDCNPPTCIAPTPAAELGSPTLSFFTGTTCQFDVVAQSNTLNNPGVTIAGVTVVAAQYINGVCGPFIYNLPGLPMGAVHNPPLPVSGQPASSTLTWTPTANQVGCFRFTYHLVDNLGNTADCTINVHVVECMMMCGVTPVSLPVGPNDVLRVLPIIIQPVTMTSIPGLQIPANPAFHGFKLYTQVMMFNPGVYPTDALRLSQGLEYTIGVGATTYGTGSGMYIFAPQPVVNPGDTLTIGFGIN